MARATDGTCSKAPASLMPGGRGWAADSYRGHPCLAVGMAPLARKWVSATAESLAPGQDSARSLSPARSAPSDYRIATQPLAAIQEHRAG